MNKWIKVLTIFLAVAVAVVSFMASEIVIVYDSQEEQMSGYKKGFIDGLDYQRIYLETSGRTVFYVNVTEVMEREGYDEFGRYRFISDIAKEDAVKVIEKEGFCYKIHYQDGQPKQTELINFTYYLNLSAINLTCVDDIRFYSKDYEEEYGATCRTENWVTILLPQFNITKDTWVWVHWSEEGDKFRRGVLISPFCTNPLWGGDCLWKGKEEKK